MKQLTAYLPEETVAAMRSLSAEGESLNAFIRTAVEAEARRRTFAGMDQAIAAVVDPAAQADWHAANVAFIETRGDAA